MTLKERENTHGQVALVVILVVIVITVVVLSVASRSVTEVRVTTTEEDAAKALRLAEAGVEEALRTLSPAEFSSSAGEGSFSVVSNQAGATGFVSSAVIYNGDVIEVTLDPSGAMPTSMDIYWSDRNDPSQNSVAMPALEVAVYKNSAGTMSVRHLAYDPVESRRTATSKMSIPTLNPGVYEGVTFGAKANIPIQAGDTQVRIKSVFSRASIAVKPLPDGIVMPTQQFRVVSSGEVAGKTTRAVEVVRNNPMLPGVFDAALYSGSAISK